MSAEAAPPRATTPEPRGRRRWLIEYQGFSDNIHNFTVRRPSQAEHEGADVWYTRDLRCTSCSGPLSAMMATCEHANAVRRAIQAGRFPEVPALPVKKRLRSPLAGSPPTTPEPMTDDADATFLTNYAAALRRIAKAGRKRGRVFGPECVDVQAPIFERIADRLRSPLAGSPPTPPPCEWCNGHPDFNGPHGNGVCAPLAEPSPESGALRHEADEYLTTSVDLRATNLVLSLLDRLSTLERDAARWHAIRTVLDVDGDIIGNDGHGPHVQWITADEGKLCDAAQPGWTHTVESLADALAPSGEPTTERRDNG